MVQGSFSFYFGESRALTRVLQDGTGHGAGQGAAAQVSCYQEGFQNQKASFVDSKPDCLIE